MIYLFKTTKKNPKKTTSGVFSASVEHTLRIKFSWHGSLLENVKCKGVFFGGGDECTHVGAVIMNVLSAQVTRGTMYAGVTQKS